jgi:hypothetical protein
MHAGSLQDERHQLGFFGFHCTALGKFYVVGITQLLHTDRLDVGSQVYLFSMEAWHRIQYPK